MIESADKVLAIFGLGPWEIIAILVVALLIFGRRLPEIARSMGKSLNEFKKGMQETKDEVDKTIEPDDKDKKQDKV